MAHLKSLSAPKTWPIERKKHVFVTKANPGPHTKENALPFIVVVRDMLKIVHTTHEAKKIITAGKVLVNNRIRKETKYPVGMLDSISIPGSNEYYRVLFNAQGKFITKKISPEQAKEKYVKIQNKTTLKGKRTQLNFLDGSNMLIDKDNYKVGDTLLLQEGKVKHLKFEKGAWVYIVAGKHIGKKGRLEEVLTFKGSQPDRVVLKQENEKIDTLREFAFVVDEGFEHG